VKLPLVDKSTGYTLHSSIWLFADRANPVASGCPQEIDVVEQYARYPIPTSIATANLHPFNGTKSAADGCSKVNYARPRSTAAAGDWSSEWTTFTVDWTERYIAMMVNGQTYANYAGTDPAAIAAFTDPLFLALTACVMDRVPPLVTDVFPLEYLVDSVKVYEWV
jgi:hypothetical protein